MLHAARPPRFLLPLLLAVLAVLAPATAGAAPHASKAPVAAHQDGWGDDWDDADGDGWPDDGEFADDGWGDESEDVVPVPTVVPGVVPTPTPTPEPEWTPEAEPEIELVTTATVAGKVAKLRKGGKAAIPRKAPLRVRRVIAAANRIVGKPYKWGGGHAKLEDRGYDCSGTVSYTLIRSQLLSYSMVSGSFAKWGRGGAGKWITIYANKGHVYMEVAGLRLDTSAMGDPRGGNGPRWRPAIGKRRGFHVRHIAGL